MLDSHKHVWGLGEDSIFNSNLPAFRDNIVRASVEGNDIQEVLIDYADLVLNKMKDLAVLDLKKSKGKKKVKDLKRMTDKMLFNYKNIGEIQRFVYFFDVLFIYLFIHYCDIM